MGHRLIITNGDSAVSRMQEARISGEILPWRDILHEGPVPGGLSLEELSLVRANFLSQRGWLSVDELHHAFATRDDMLKRHGDFAEVILWFEHDLYDQLQLLQVLDYLAAANRRDGLFLVQAGKYLGLETAKTLRHHLLLKEPVQEAHFALAKLAWAGFRSPSPEPWVSLIKLRTHVLPFLRLAMLRLLDELPGARTGLSRTEFTIIKLISEGVRTPFALFQEFTEREEVFFMGDWSFYHALDNLGAGGSPILAGFRGLSFQPDMREDLRDAYLSTELSLTHIGYSVLKGRADALSYRPLSRDLGGLHLNSTSAWRWDRQTQQLIAPSQHSVK